MLMAIFAGGCAFGSLFGGWAADQVASIFPHSGRILCAQFSAFMETGSTREAYALSRGLFSMMVIPFGLCCLFYTPLHFVYKHDRDEVRAMSSMDEELHLMASSD
ncbi:hypothetical protein SUGI_0436140 [Cryptomeria japonica]|nr:hypothetical protein SUGI_0436140 [Cryptomeria japonica]